jgi:hypothetical protein
MAACRSGPARSRGRRGPDRPRATTGPEWGSDRNGEKNSDLHRDCRSAGSLSGRNPREKRTDATASRQDTRRRRRGRRSCGSPRHIGAIHTQPGRGRRSPVAVDLVSDVNRGWLACVTCRSERHSPWVAGGLAQRIAFASSMFPADAPNRRRRRLRLRTRRLSRSPRGFGSRHSWTRPTAAPAPFPTVARAASPGAIPSRPAFRWG